MRGKILDAARELFVKEGYDAVTMRRIAEKIEYSPTAIHVHFEDKAALVRALCDRDFGELSEKFAAIARIPDPVEKLHKLGEAYVKFGLSLPSHYRFMFMTPGLPSKVELSRLERGNPDQDAYALLRSTVVQVMAAGLMRKDLKDPDLVAQVVWASVHGIVALAIAKGEDRWVDWRPVKKVTALLVDTLMRGLMAEEI
ncbi:MAG: TetR/AcrR family transcriptional regulator [Acidobacteriota bacterium]